MEERESTETRESPFKKVLGKWDLIVISLGAMLGWGWVVSTGQWIESGGVLGAALGFVVGGIMIFLIGICYSELTSAMPECGGEHVFSYKALGVKGSFVCTWAIVLGYVSVVCFEACTVPVIISYILPDFQQVYLYTVAGFKIYLTNIILAMILAIVILYLNFRGTKIAARVQAVLTAIIMMVGIILVVASAINGNLSNLESQAFLGDGSSAVFKSIITVAALTPFYFIGFDVIPQTAEEINIPFKKVGMILGLSIVVAIAFYALVIIAVGLMLDPAGIASSQLTTADAMAKAFNSQTMADVLIIGGLCGVITSWNAFMMGGSRAIYSMAESNMVPKIFAKLHPKYNSPYVALILIGIASILAPFAGRKALIWVSDAGNLGCCLAYFIVVLSFLILRKKRPEMHRPYKAKYGNAVGIAALIISGALIVMYVIPGTSVSLVWQEWAIVGAWFILGLVFAIMSKIKYGEDFGKHLDLDMACMRKVEKRLEEEKEEERRKNLE